MIKVPPPLQTLIAGVAMKGVSVLVPFMLYDEGVILYAFIFFLIVTSALFLLPAVISFWKNKTTVNPIKPENATTLVVEGVYRFTRNPMYLGMAMLLLAWGLYLANPLNILVLALYMYIMTTIQIKPEEQALNTIFGDQYKKYCDDVRRWV